MYAYKPKAHIPLAFFGLVGADKAIHFALGTLQILFSFIQILFVKTTFA